MDNIKGNCTRCGNEVTNDEDYEEFFMSLYCENCCNESDEAQDTSDNSSCYSVDLSS